MRGLHYWVWILNVGWLLFLLLLFKHFWRKRQGLSHAQSWLKSKGRITRFELTEEDQSLWPRIEYTYTVYDKDLTGEYLFLDTAHNNPNSKYARRIAYKAAVAFKENQEIEVYYNPNHPEQSALDVTVPVKLTFILMMLGLLIAVHLGSLVFRYLGL
ncbi:MAG: DUF3592 domain-containing protein [Legionellales bacterium]